MAPLPQFCSNGADRPNTNTCSVRRRRPTLENDTLVIVTAYNFSGSVGSDRTTASESTWMVDGSPVSAAPPASKISAVYELTTPNGTPKSVTTKSPATVAFNAPATASVTPSAVRHTVI